MGCINELIERYKRIRSKAQLQNVYVGKYAFVGIGNHSINNLYPVLDYLRVPLKYICCKSADKVALINRKCVGVEATTSLERVVDDDEIAGVFVSASPAAHFSIAKQVLKSGKSLFIEKPPCMNIEELELLDDLAQQNGAPIVVVGMQKRYSPITGLLVNRLKRSGGIVSYNMKYATGLYPEGDAILDLFIHPLDYVSYLFGKAEVQGFDCVRTSDGALTVMLILRHGSVRGILELSTGYSWREAQEQLSVNTRGGTYCIKQMEELAFVRRQGAICGIPMEKIRRSGVVVEKLFDRNNFTPTLFDNQIYTQGYFGEVKTFVDMVEGKRWRGETRSSFKSMMNTFSLIRDIKKYQSAIMI